LSLRTNITWKSIRRRVAPVSLLFKAREIERYNSDHGRSAGNHLGLGSGASWSRHPPARYPSGKCNRGQPYPEALSWSRHPTTLEPSGVRRQVCTWRFAGISQNVGFSPTYRSFDAVPTFPAKLTPGLPSRKSNCRIAMKIEVSNNERTDTCGGASKSRLALMHSSVFNVPR